MLKNLARKYISSSIWGQLQSWREDTQIRKLYRDWLKARVSLVPVTGSGPHIVLLIPSDPREIVGSCGDEAMVCAMMQMAKRAYTNVEIHVLVWGEEASDVARRLGLVGIPLWDQSNFVEAAIELLQSNKYTNVLGMGADIIDGFYRAIEPAKQLVVLDLATRLGVPSAVLGASFSTKPDVRLKVFFDALDLNVKLFIRDEISLARARAFTVATTELVADSAFVLDAAAPDVETMIWIDARRAEGKQVIGFNVHPMLLANKDDDAQDQLINPACHALLRITANRPVAWLLIPHDRRVVAGDNSVLEPIYKRLKADLGDDIRLFSGFRAAAELKAIAAQLDGVVTGRMHLAIGSLGGGTPVLCVTYQDKFEGLMIHFDLPTTALISMAEFSDTAILALRLEQFLDSVGELRIKVAERHDRVIAQSARNFSVFRPAYSVTVT